MLIPWKKPISQNKIYERLLATQIDIIELLDNDTKINKIEIPRTEDGTLELDNITLDIKLICLFNSIANSFVTIVLFLSINL